MSSEPNREDFDCTPGWLSQRRRELKAEGDARYLSGALRFLGVKKAEAEFDGYGDAGALKTTRYSPVQEAPLPPGLDEAISSLFMGMLPADLDFDALGTVCLDVSTGKCAAILRDYQGEESNDEEID